MGRSAAILVLPLALLFATVTGGEEPPIIREVSFATADGGTVFANLLGQGDHGVVLAHGRVFDKESWQPFAQVLSDNGLTVLAIDFRGYGKSVPGSQPRALDEDILAAIHYLREAGARTVSVVGGSMGGTAAARAAMAASPGEIDRLILLAPGPLEQAGRLHAGHVLFVVTEGDRGLTGVEQSFAKTPEPKELVVLEGSAHAQHIFKTEQGARLTQILLADLTKQANPEQP
jgi:dienelactone hydrolase